ncbi:MAG: SAM-dependent methyltransferase [Ruminococcus sp.]|nr:SAM-dependent methyltransferase [Ruminococcus sp.]
MNHPDNRLRLCASFVRRGARLADIGTDHAYLPVWLCRSGICPSAIAADINPEPLRRGAMTVAAAGLCDMITTRLSNGLQAISADEADDIVIAGMGGELIAGIISDCAFSHDRTKHWILQPMTKSETLIAWLCDNGYVILRQDCCVAANKCYTVILAAYTGESPPRDTLYPYLGELCPRENNTHLRFVRAHLERLRKQAIGNPRFAALADALQKETGVLYDNHTGHSELL